MCLPCSWGHGQRGLCKRGGRGFFAFGRALDVPALLSALGGAGNVLSALQAFSFRLSASKAHSAVHLQHPSQPAYYLKASPGLAGECARTMWLRPYLPVPEVHYFVEEDGRDLLLLSAVPGQVLEHLTPTETLVRGLAQTLKTLHAIPLSACPFDARLEVRIAAATRRTEAGLVDEDDFDPQRLGRTAADLLEELLGRRPAHEDLVVTHGDFVVSNILATGEAITGVIDLGRVGIGDRTQDLGLVGDSIREEFGEAWMHLFFAEYGVDLDEERLDYFKLLDEFF
jgi:aminoglycoside 3'-phosphotransferase II